MNKNRRQELHDVVEHLDEAIERIQEIRDDEEASFENLPEGLQGSATGDRMQEAMDTLDEFASDIENIRDDIMEMIENK